MTGLAWFVLGSMFGGCVGVVTICCIQINRLSDYEQEIYRLKDALNKKE